MVVLQRLHLNAAHVVVHPMDLERGRCMSNEYNCSSTVDGRRLSSLPTRNYAPGARLFLEIEQAKGAGVPVGFVRQIHVAS